MVARRPYWKGVLKLSLVTCPVALYPASSQSEKTHFHQINRKTGNRLRQRLVDEETGAEVERGDRARGYEIAKGQYVEIEAAELDAIEIDSTHTLEIEKFVPKADIDKRYYERPYYVVPDGKGSEEAFAVLRDAMTNQRSVAVARVVFSSREHIVALEAWGKGMLCTTLRYDYEVRPEGELFAEIPSPRVSKEMVDLAAHILKSKAGRFDPSGFKDEYEMALKALVERKAKGQPIRRDERRATSNVVDLMSALRESLKSGQATRSSAKSSPRAKSRRLKKAG